MELTDTQIKNISNLKVEIQIEILHTCVDALGLLSVDEYHEYSKIPKRTIYKQIEDKKLSYLNICGRTLIIMS